MKKTIAKYIVWVTLVVFSSCKLDGLQDNPNYIAQSQANIDFLLNNVQVEFGNFFNNASSRGMELTRMRALISGANYNNAYQITTFDPMWESFYSTSLPDFNKIIAQGEESGLYIHAGIAKVLKAYELVTMVDNFGDIPYSQALDPTNFNPQVDPAAGLYDTALGILDEAIADFGKTSSATVANDMFYAGSTKKWITAAKTIKLKIYLQRRLVDTNAKAEIQALITSGNIDLIDAADGSEDFVFTYPGNSIANPDTRHPFFTDSYINGAGAYMSNSYMLALYNGRGGFSDPRIRYYFYRQSTQEGTDVNLISCYGLPAPAHYPAGSAWCQDPNGYWGRDHLNNDGTGPDNRVRTAYGLYPGGGKFDGSEGVQTTVNDGNKGKGIWPVLLSSFTYFMRAEAALTLGTSDDAKLMLTTAVAQSITKVTKFADVTSTRVPTTAAINGYEAAVATDYDTAPEKLQVVMKEYWVAAWGNGIEPYNGYRRTGYPNDLQPARNPQPGDFYRSLSYPSDFVTRNQNATQHAVGAQVFWDTNPAGFIK